MERKIIAVNGTIGSGKDTLSSVFVTDGWQRMSFAKNLKDAISCIFGWDREMLEGNSAESREWRNQPDQYWSECFGKPVTPRWVLQYFGTDVVRKFMLDSIWIMSLKKELMQYNSPVIITDCRFPNEIAMVRSMGGIIIEVQRDLPSWYDDAVLMNTGLKGADNDTVLEMYESFSEKHNIHASEFAWVGVNDPDYTVHNIYSLDSLYTSALSILNMIKK